MHQTHKSVLEGIKRRMALIVGSGRINQYTKGRLAQTTWEGDDQEENTRVWQHFGFRSLPPKGTDCIGICSGSRDKIVVIATDNEADLEVLEGESLQYAEDQGKVACHIHLGQDGTITIRADKIQIKNNEGKDLLASIKDCLDMLSISKTNTGIGPQSLEPFATEYPVKLKQVIKNFLAG